MGRSRRRSTAENAALALYWLSGVALFIEPFRWAAKSKAKQQQRQMAWASQQSALATASAASAQRVLAEQQAQEVYERRQRAAAAARPMVCRYCKFTNPPGSKSCSNCGAH